MSDTDGFIEEVAEEVRKDQLYGYFKKYGWIAAVLIAVIVGGAGYLEWSKAKEMSAAQDRGDAILAALDNQEPDQQLTALAKLAPNAGAASAVVDMQRAALLSAEGQIETAVSLLNSVSENSEYKQIYRDIAQFKALVLRGKDMDAAERMTILNALATPGHKLRALAQEQIAVAKIDAGDTQGAIETLTALMEEQNVTAGMRQRVSQLLIALGGEIPAQAQLLFGH